MSRRSLARLALSALTALAATAPGAAGARRAPGLSRPLPERVVDPDLWLAERVAADEALGVWPVALPRIHRNVDGVAPIAVLFIHGWGACRAEGELTIDQIADEWGANVLYLRLPGHGLDGEAMVRAQPEAYTRAVADALNAAEALGEQVVVVGSSTGGLLATWASATYPERIDATVLASPLYAYSAGWVGPVAGNRLGVGLVQLVLGKERYAGWEGTEPDLSQPGYDDHWTIQQQYAAMARLEMLRRAVLKAPGVPEGVRQPVLLVHHYRDEDFQDNVVSVAAMREMFDRFRNGVPHPKSRWAPVAEANHILLSEYVKVDHDAVLAEFRSFFADVFGPPSAP